MRDYNKKTKAKWEKRVSDRAERIKNGGVPPRKSLVVLEPTSAFEVQKDKTRMTFFKTKFGQPAPDYKAVSIVDPGITK
jgi:hypothetical protein